MKISNIVQHNNNNNNNNNNKFGQKYKLHLTMRAMYGIVK